MIGQGFVGVNPIALLGLAETAEQYAARVRAVGRSAEAALRRHPDVAGETVCLFSGVAAALDGEAEELRWRATVIEEAQHPAKLPILGHHRLAADRAVFAALAPFDLEHLEKAYERWRELPDVAEVAALSPGEVNALFAEAEPYLAEAFAHRYPQVVGALDGAPATLRYLANRVLIDRRIDATRSQIAEMKAANLESPLIWDNGWVLSGWASSPALRRELIERFRLRIDLYERWLDEDRQIILFDPSGDGRVAEVFGDVDSASHIAVVVPGMSNELGNFDAPDGGFRANAARLYAASRVLGGPEVATIAWLGYDSPDGLDAAAIGAARQGAPALARFLEGIDPGVDRQVTVVAHSYGSLVAGVAAAEQIPVDNLVFVGSPGTSLDRAADAELRPQGRVWAALADGDPIGVGVSARELVPPPWVPFPLIPTWIVTDMLEQGAEGLWHGTNPIADEFGAVRIGTEGSSGHSEYFEHESLLNLLRITQGLYTEVEFAE